MKPPLANCGPAVQKSNRVTVAPLMLTRRIGSAWETAQKAVPLRHPVSPWTLIVRFDSERQKLSSAEQLEAVKHWLYTSMWPLMTTSAGDPPRPATSV